MKFTLFELVDHKSADQIIDSATDDELRAALMDFWTNGLEDYKTWDFIELIKDLYTNGTKALNDYTREMMVSELKAELAIMQEEDR